MVNHANIRLPEPMGRWLRLIVVTPSTHRVHRSIARREHDANHGFNRAIRNRRFGVHVAQPVMGRAGTAIGLKPRQHGGPVRLGFTLALAFRRLRG
jgi:sterol desaturase/sphingolipid hydroxylase (fatty acid hydroxylase superfamily)